MVKSWQLLYYKYKLDRIIRVHDFEQIITKDLKCFKSFYALLKGIIQENNFSALLVLSDQPFMERVSIAIFHELGKPSFIFSHGLPGTYSLDCDNRSDWLMVWGDAIRSNYLKVGFKPDKVITVGNPKYKKPFNMDVKWDDSRIVVVPESAIVWQQEGYGNPVFPDRTRIIVYLYEVEVVLKSLGYNKAYFRPHPSISREWIKKFIDKDFYEEDYVSLSESLTSATLVIGATSTVMLEYLMSSVNYIVYERPLGNTLYAPFDGTDPRVPYSNNPEGLENLLRNHSVADSSLVCDYMKPLDVETIISKIKETTK